MSKKFFLFIFYCLINFIYCFTYSKINESNYQKLEYDFGNDEFILIKNKSNNNIPNDGFFIDFNQTFNQPKHLSFLYSIPNFENYDDSFIYLSFYEGCDVRLTTTSESEILKNNYKTNDNSDVIFFRIRLPHKINFNELPVYIPQVKNNYKMNEEYYKIDILMDWKKSKGVLLFNEQYIWDVANSQGKKDKFNVKTKTYFYHNSINSSDFHVILYNFKPNTTCYIKNLKLCENFCDSKIESIYQKYLNEFYVKYNILFILFYLIVI